MPMSSFLLNKANLNKEIKCKQIKGLENLDKVIGIAMIDKPYFNVDQEFEINLIDKSNKNIHKGKICNLPFV